MVFKQLIILLATLYVVSGCVQGSNIVSSLAADSEKPNIILIVFDDLGFSDLGVYGSEIATPNIDRLAKAGMLFTNFHASPSCSLTRAMLLTGNEAHQAGLGTMYERRQPYQRGKLGYEGYLSDRVVTVARRLADTGYSTYMAGKWHLGYEADQNPASRGFKRSFALLDGGANHFNSTGVREKPLASFTENGRVAVLPDEFYSSDFYTDKLIEYIDQGEPNNPFFGYLAYTAPHWPLQAPPEDIAKYDGTYDEGFDALYKNRFKKMKALGLVPSDQDESTFLSGNDRWSDLSEDQQARRAKEMAIYAAMIDRVDQNIGRLLVYLKRQQHLDNTVIFLLSDNGAMGNALNKKVYRSWISQADNSIENMGSDSSYLYHHYGWARVSNAPFKGIKMHVNEGGLRVPAIAWYPARIAAGTVNRELLSVMDVTPTLLELAGAQTRYEQNAHLVDAEGHSMWPMWKGETQSIRQPSDTIAWEAWGERVLMNERWKLINAPKPYGIGHWQLYDLKKDLGESVDLAQRHPKTVEQLVAQWERYAAKVGVVLPNESVLEQTN